MNNEDSNERPDRGERPLSPCILICTLDDDEVCVGCGRSLKQISGWALMSKDEQWAVVEQLAQRESDI